MAKPRTSQLPVSYIVRVYRREPQEQIAGTVEIPEVDERTEFVNFDELKAILLRQPRSESDR